MSMVTGPASMDEALAMLERAAEFLADAARAGADLRALAAICAEIRSRTAPPDPDDERDPDLDRGLSVETTFGGAGVIHGDLAPGCAAMVTAVLDALSAPRGSGDLRTRPQRYHDALAEAIGCRPACIAPGGWERLDAAALGSCQNDPMRNDSS